MLRRDTTLPKRIIITPYPPEPHPTLNSIWPLINFHPVLLLLHSSRLYFSHFLSRPFPPLSTLIFDTSSQQQQHHQSSPVLSCFLEPNLIDWPVLWQTGVVLFWFTLSFHLPLLHRLSFSHTHSLSPTKPAAGGQWQTAQTLCLSIKRWCCSWPGLDALLRIPPHAVVLYSTHPLAKLHDNRQATVDCKRVGLQTLAPLKGFPANNKHCVATDHDHTRFLFHILLLDGYSSGRPFIRFQFIQTSFVLLSNWTFAVDPYHEVIKVRLLLM